MAKQRYINTRFWDDGYIVTLDPIEKLLFIYFLTNPLTEIYGAYELPLRRIAFDTGIDRDAIVKIIDRFTEAGKVHYVDGWIVITNFIKHQSLNPKIIASIRDAMTRLPKKVVDLLEFEYAPKAKVKRKQVSPATRKRILQRDNGTCQICGATENPEIDHIQPVVMGGDNSDGNLRVLCQKCNGQRNAELRWNRAGEVKIENSLPSNMGSLSHLNSNSNRDSNSNLNRMRGKAASPPHPALLVPAHECPAVQVYQEKFSVNVSNAFAKEVLDNVHDLGLWTRLISEKIAFAAGTTAERQRIAKWFLKAYYERVDQKKNERKQNSKLQSAADKLASDEADRINRPIIKPPMQGVS